jgi:hypothetical protein
VIDGVREPCEECGFDPLAYGPAELPDAIRGLSRRYSIPLSRFLPGEDGDVVVRARPQIDTWSALECACHVRDCLNLFDQRITVMLAEDAPAFESWDHDAAVEAQAYNAEDPAMVAAQVGEAAEALATTLQLAPADGWERIGSRDGEVYTVLDYGRYALHEGHHHLLDVGRALRTARGR